MIFAWRIPDRFAELFILGWQIAFQSMVLMFANPFRLQHLGFIRDDQMEKSVQLSWADIPTELQILSRDSMLMVFVLSVMSAFFSFAHVRTKFSWLLPSISWAICTLNRAFLSGGSTSLVESNVLGVFLFAGGASLWFGGYFYEQNHRKLWSHTKAIFQGEAGAEVNRLPAIRFSVPVAIGSVEMLKDGASRSEQFRSRLNNLTFFNTTQTASADEPAQLIPTAQSSPPLPKLSGLRAAFTVDNLPEADDDTSNPSGEMFESHISLVVLPQAITVGRLSSSRLSASRTETQIAPDVDLEDGLLRQVALCCSDKDKMRSSSWRCVFVS
jgi:hypothetical protein